MAADVFAAVVRNLQALSTETLENLVAVLPKFDFAVLVLTGDDLTTSRHIKTASPRDNVVFETGLFMGRIGRERTFSGSGAIRGRDEQWVDDLGLVSGYKASSAAQTTGAVAKLMGSFPI